MKFKTHHLLIIVIVLVIAYFLFMRNSGNPFGATDKSAAPGLLHSTRF